MIDPYIQQYGRRLYGLCRHLCANVLDADDLYQETWMKSVKNFARYDPAKPFEPWLTRICVNTYRSAWRHLRRAPMFEFADNAEKDAVLQAVPAPKRQDYTALYAAVNRLPEKLRLTVVLFYFRDMDTVSAAAVLNIPPGTVKSRLNKARQRLKEELKDEADLFF